MKYTFRERGFRIFENRRNNSVRAGELLSQWMMSDFATEWARPGKSGLWGFWDLEKKRNSKDVVT